MKKSPRQKPNTLRPTNPAYGVQYSHLLCIFNSCRNRHKDKSFNLKFLRFQCFKIHAPPLLLFAYNYTTNKLKNTVYNISYMTAVGDIQTKKIWQDFIWYYNTNNITKEQIHEQWKNNTHLQKEIYARTVQKQLLQRQAPRRQMSKIHLVKLQRYARSI